MPTRADLPAIEALLARANETPYDIVRVAEEKVFGRGFRGEPRPLVYEEDGEIIGISVVCGEFLRLIAVDPAHRRRGIGSQLLAGRVAFAEPGNYFTPGIVESDTATRAFLAKHGFVEKGATHNLVTTQLRYDVHVGRGPALAFIEREFGAAWRFECERAGERLLYIEDAGFAAYDTNNHGLGTFGPLGVAKSARGRGLGTLLVRAALSELAKLGYRRVVIPWTDAVEFYAKACAARVAHRFVLMSLR